MQRWESGLDERLEQLDTDGFTVVPNVLDRETTARIRELIDRNLPPVGTPAADGGYRHSIWHPIHDPLMAELLAVAPTLALAQRLLRSPDVRDLRLIGQELYRSDPQPSPYPAPFFHNDIAFFPSDHESTPRQTYFQMIHLCSDVVEGRAPTLIVPGSHRRLYDVTATFTERSELRQFGVFPLHDRKADPFEASSSDRSQVVEVLGEEGGVLVVDPMCVHAASENRTDEPRYVYFVHVCDASAAYLGGVLGQMQWRDRAVEGLRDTVRPEVAHLLEPLAAVSQS